MIKIIICPFCDQEIRSGGKWRMDAFNRKPASIERVVRCWNCGEAFEREPDEEEFVFGPDGAL